MSLLPQQFLLLARPATAINIAADMMAAIVVQLRRSSDLITALGEDVTVAGGTKIWADDEAFSLPALPYLTYSEPGGNKAYVFGGGWYEPGTFLLSIMASTKVAARTLGILAAKALNDQAANMPYSGGIFTYLREDITSSQTVEPVGPATPAQYKRIVTMRYMTAGTLASE